jgi:hypothetical protein
MIRVLSLVVILTCSLGVQAQPVASKNEQDLIVNGELTKDDPADKVYANNSNGHYKVHEFHMTAGKRYRIEMSSSRFNFWLRLEDPDGKSIREIVNNNPAHMEHVPIRSGKYRIVATSVGSTGKYTLRAFGMWDRKTTPKDKEKSLVTTHVLSTSDPVYEIERKDKKRGGRHYFKVYEYKMTAGNMYTIDMIRGTLPDPYLRLEDAGGKEVAFDDDSGGNMNARIIFMAPRTETYKILATSFGPNQVGSFTLHVNPGKVPPLVTSTGTSMPVPMVMDHSYGDIRVSMEPMVFGSNLAGGSLSDAHGYLEHRFTVSNRSSSQSHRVTLTLPRYKTSHWNGPFLRSVQATVDMGPGLSVPVSLLQPDLPWPGNNDVEIAIDGKKERDALPIGAMPNRSNRYGSYGASGNLPQYILTTADFQQLMDSNVFKYGIGDKGAALPPAHPFQFGMRNGTYRGMNYSVPAFHRFFAASGAPASWSSNWLGYSPYDGIVVAGFQLDSTPPEALAPLWHYVECGGALVVLGPARLPDGWRRTETRLNGFTAYYPGFGQCLVSQEDIGTWEPQQWRTLTSMWDTSHRPFQKIASPSDANRRFPVVDNLTIPVRELFVVMLLFAILIGPVNVYVLTRKKRRIWLLWTVPVFSFLTCLAVFGFMLFSEGWQGRVRVAGITVLDEVSQRATSVGWLAVYSPLTPGDGLRFSRDTELLPQLHSDRHRNPSPRSVNWSADQHLDSGWVSARVPAHFKFRSSEKRLERLIVEKGDAGALNIVNGLKAPIRTVWLADKEGKVYTAEGIPAGSKSALKLEPGLHANAKPGVIRGLFDKEWDRAVNAAFESAGDAFARQYLRPGSYIALMEATPFCEDGLAHARHRNSRGIVFGILKD